MPIRRVTSKKRGSRYYGRGHQRHKSGAKRGTGNANSIKNARLRVRPHPCTPRSRYYPIHCFPINSWKVLQNTLQVTLHPGVMRKSLRGLKRLTTRGVRIVGSPGAETPLGRLTSRKPEWANVTHLRIHWYGSGIIHVSKPLSSVVSIVRKSS